MEFDGKKILIVATTDDMIGRFMIPHIKYLQNSGAKIDCACSKTGFWFEEINKQTNSLTHNISFTRFPFTIKNIKARKMLFKLCKNNHYDLIICMQPVGGVVGRMAGHKFGIKVIYIAHGFHFYNGAPIQNMLIYKTIEKHYAKYTDILITMNEEDYRASLKMKAKQNFKINGIGVDLSVYKNCEDFDKNSFKTELGLNENDFVITSIGELNKNKNTFRLLEVIKNINDKNVKYLVCGEGPLRHKYEKYIDNNNLNDRVKVLGFRKDIPDILGITDLYIMPSYREGLSKSMMEAMCYGLPIVASKIRGNIDLIGDNAGGFLFNPNDNNDIRNCIIKIKDNENLVQIFSKRNLSFIKNYDINVVLQQMEEIYKGIKF